MKYLLILTLLAALSCTKSNVAPQSHNNASNAILGTWTQDSAHYSNHTVNESCCGWSDNITFNSDGTGQDKTVNGIDGSGKWSVTGNTLNVNYELSPSTLGSYTYTITGNRLVLNGPAYIAYYHK